MKYFTMEWWIGAQDGTNELDPSEAYSKYYQEVRSKLPNAFIELHESVSLHDGEIRQLSCDHNNQKLEMKIHADDGNGNLREICLNYYGVSFFKLESNRDQALPGPVGIGDIGYCEVEMNDDEVEHRLLFSSASQLTIRCKGLNITYIDHQ